ncbi:hypothetical protein CGMCC3_g16442 [Colletotrichum fructicola]|nr:uncharacterized protein CGMCC3_g16442 [Colletotrichum fructicola]KAE9567467.1 hypothetical protein CGMCC3_g16442 [Colletotrichum fructicola]
MNTQLDSLDIHLTNALMPWTITSNVPLRKIPFMDTGTPGHCGSHLSATERITASGNLFWASESNSKTYSEKQNGSSGDEISVSSESQKVIEFVMHEPMTNDERTKKRAGTSKTNQKKPPKGHSDKHWEMLRDNHLRRLYIQESHTVDEVVFEMLVIHGHRFTKPTLERKLKLWGFSKNSPRRQGSGGLVAQRRRVAYSMPATATIVKSLKFASLNERRLALDRQRPQFGLATTYVQQEKMFHALDHLVKGLFASGCQSWKVANPQMPLHRNTV